MCSCLATLVECQGCMEHLHVVPAMSGLEWSMHAATVIDTSMSHIMYM